MIIKLCFVIINLRFVATSKNWGGGGGGGGGNMVRQRGERGRAGWMKHFSGGDTLMAVFMFNDQTISQGHIWKCDLSLKLHPKN